MPSKTSRGLPRSLKNMAPATTTTRGPVKQATFQSDSNAENVTALKIDFNQLLARLRTAGILDPIG